MFSYGIGSLLAPLVLGMVMDQAEHYDFYSYFLGCAGLLALFAWQQKPVPEDKRSVHVNMFGAAGPMMADLDPRNDSGVLKPFDEMEAQAYADELEREMDKLTEQEKTTTSK